MKTANTDNVLGTYLREARLKEGLTQQEAATCAGLSVAFLSFIENGHQVPSAKSILKLTKAYPTTDAEEMLLSFGYSANLNAPPRRPRIMARPSLHIYGDVQMPSGGQEIREEPYPVVDEWRLDWALSCAAHDPHYGLAAGWEELPFIAKVYAVQLYQGDTRRMLLTREETISLNELTRGPHSQVQIKTETPDLDFSDSNSE